MTIKKKKNHIKRFLTLTHSTKQNPSYTDHSINPASSERTKSVFMQSLIFHFTADISTMVNVYVSEKGLRHINLSLSKLIFFVLFIVTTV